MCVSHTSQPHNMYAFVCTVYTVCIVCVCVCCAAKDGSEEAGECKERSHEEN